MPRGRINMLKSFLRAAASSSPDRARLEQPAAQAVRAERRLQTFRAQPIISRSLSMIITRPGGLPLKFLAAQFLFCAGLFHRHKLAGSRAQKTASNRRQGVPTPALLCRRWRPRATRCRRASDGFMRSISTATASNSTSRTRAPRCSPAEGSTGPGGSRKLPTSPS
jgi:hypothetical protein